MFLLSSVVAGRRPQCSAGAGQQGMYSIIPVPDATRVVHQRMNANGFLLPYDLFS